MSKPVGRGSGDLVDLLDGWWRFVVSTHFAPWQRRDMSGASKSLPRLAPDFSDGLRSKTTDRTDRSPTTIFKNRMLGYFPAAGTIKV